MKAPRANYPSPGKLTRWFATCSSWTKFTHDMISVRRVCVSVLLTPMQGSDRASRYRVMQLLRVLT